MEGNEVGLPQRERTLGARNAFKLGIFGMNCASGLAATTVPERWKPTWESNVAVAQIAEEAGLDFLLPLARWRGYRGTSDFEGSSLETLAWAGGLLASTRTITVFGTVHAPLVHPVFAAKQMATLDHIGRGRFGLNIVCGWNPDEFDMFGVDPRTHEDRYHYGEEWWNVVRRLWSEEKDFDVEGRFFDLKGLRSEPGPWGETRPLVINAGSSAAGREFAARNCDLLFTVVTDLERGRKDLDQAKSLAASVGRSIEVVTTSYVVCRPTRAEAEEYHHHYAVECADLEAVDHWYGMQSQHTKGRAPELEQLFRQRFAGGHGCYPLIGSPDDVAAEIAQLAGIGLAGTTLAFVDYLAELPYFAAEVLPRIEQLKLRQGIP